MDSPDESDFGKFKIITLEQSSKTAWGALHKELDAQARKLGVCKNISMSNRETGEHHAILIGFDDDRYEVSDPGYAGNLDDGATKFVMSTIKEKFNAMEHWAGDFSSRSGPKSWIGQGPAENWGGIYEEMSVWADGKGLSFGIGLDENSDTYYVEAIGPTSLKRTASGFKSPWPAFDELKTQMAA